MSTTERVPRAVGDEGETVLFVEGDFVRARAGGTVAAILRVAVSMIVTPP